MNTVFKEYFSPPAIKLAYHRVACWQERIVKDRLGLNAFGKNLDANCESLSQKVISGGYRPGRGIKFYMPKASRTQRTKTLLFIEDAIIYQAIVNRISERVFPQLKRHDAFVFGSVLHPNTGKGLALLEENEPDFYFFQYWQILYQKFRDSVIHTIEEDNVQYKFETDITGFFDSIPHYNLLLTLSEEFKVEDDILDLLGDCLNRWSGTKERSTPGVGIPQGPAPSYFLANILLYPLDEAMVREGKQYYRYMDDIHIYAHTEEELTDVLVYIDNYTKGHGLSINSKKTSIERITDSKNDPTVKEFKKMRFFSLTEVDELEIIFPTESKLQFANSDDRQLKELAAAFSRLSDQDHDPMTVKVNDTGEPVTDPEEILNHWRAQQKEASDAVLNLFKSDAPFPELKDEGLTESDFLSHLFQYAQACKALHESDADVMADEALHPYWIFLLRRFFWKINLFHVVLQWYPGTEGLRNELLNLFLYQFKGYEWVRYHLLCLISSKFTFSDKELRQIFLPVLKEESSVIVRVALYRLLFLNGKGRQFLSTLTAELEQEQEPYVRFTIVDFVERIDKDRETIDSLLEMIGI